jgi:DNA-directed RNA polymerase subunit H (RpoH/RPB5)
MLAIPEQVLAAFSTLKDMLRDRGVAIDALDAIGPKDLEDLCTSQSIFTVEVNEKLRVVFFLTRMKVHDLKSSMFGKVKDIDEADIRKNDDVLHIFISKDELTALNKKSIAEYFKRHQTFTLTNLMYNVSKHSLVPKHSVVRSEEEIADITKRYNIKSKAMLPAIHQSDAMAKYLGLVPGDIVCIERPSPTTAFYKYYRICVPV